MTYILWPYKQMRCATIEYTTIQKTDYLHWHFHMLELEYVLFWLDSDTFIIDSNSMSSLPCVRWMNFQSILIAFVCYRCEIKAPNCHRFLNDHSISWHLETRKKKSQSNKKQCRFHALRYAVMLIHLLFTFDWIRFFDFFFVFYCHFTRFFCHLFIIGVRASVCVSLIMIEKKLIFKFQHEKQNIQL